ncbi:hypothetical protein [Salinibius halmophilus]|uniref:hypothetical protein n=1 Tax=Salinibius halmophilus TaxID=1853216 RepID=UPI000E67357E|nr:hypothetical protein [Salinibius halmophilus]
MRFLSAILLLFCSQLYAAEWFQTPFSEIEALANQETLSNEAHLTLALAYAQDLRVADAAEQVALTTGGMAPQLQMHKMIVDMVLANDVLDRQEYEVQFDSAMRLANSLADYQSTAWLLIHRANQAIYQRDMDGALANLEQALDVINKHDVPLLPAVELAYARYYFESANWPLMQEQLISAEQALLEQPMPAVEIEVKYLAFEYALARQPLADASAELARLLATDYPSQRLAAKIRRAEMLFAGAAEQNYIQAANALFDQIDQMQSASESLYAKHVIAHVMVENEDPQAVDAIADLSSDLHRLPRNAFRDWIELDYWLLKYQYLRGNGEFEAALFALEAHNTLSQKLWENNSANRSERLKAYFSREAAKYEQRLSEQKQTLQQVRDQADDLRLRNAVLIALASILTIALIITLVNFVKVLRKTRQYR